MDWREFLSWILNGTALKGRALSFREEEFMSIGVLSSALLDAIDLAEISGMGAKGAASFERPGAECRRSASACLATLAPFAVLWCFHVMKRPRHFTVSFMSQSSRINFET